MWELKALNKKNDFNAEQNIKILKDMKKIRKGVTKMSQSVKNLKEIRNILPNKTRERFVAWDERIANDTDFYQNMVIDFFTFYLYSKKSILCSNGFSLGKVYINNLISRLQMSKSIRWLQPESLLLIEISNNFSCTVCGFIIRAR